MPRNPANTRDVAPPPVVVVHSPDSQPPTAFELRQFAQLLAQIALSYAQSQQEKPNHEPAHS